MFNKITVFKNFEVIKIWASILKEQQSRILQISDNEVSFLSTLLRNN